MPLDIAACRMTLQSLVVQFEADRESLGNVSRSYPANCTVEGTVAVCYAICSLTSVKCRRCFGVGTPRLRRARAQLRDKVVASLMAAV